MTDLPPDLDEALRLSPMRRLRRCPARARTRLRVAQVFRTAGANHGGRLMRCLDGEARVPKGAEVTVFSEGVGRPGGSRTAVLVVEVGDGRCLAWLTREA